MHPNQELSRRAPVGIRDELNGDAEKTDSQSHREGFGVIKKATGAANELCDSLGLG